MTTQRFRRPKKRMTVNIATLNVPTIKGKVEETVYNDERKKRRHARNMSKKNKNKVQENTHEDFKYIYKGNQEGIPHLQTE